MFSNIRLGYEIRRIAHNDYLRQTWRPEVMRKIAYLKFAGHIEENE